MYLDNVFQRTIINSILYERRKKIDKIACSNKFQLENYFEITEIINSIQLKDVELEKKLKQTQFNINMILDETVRNFTIEEVNSVKKINERFQLKKEQFSDYKTARMKRESDLKDELSRTSKHDLGRIIIRYLDEDDMDFLSRYKTYVYFHYEVENPLAEITLRKWENQLTKPNEYKRGSKFKFLVHAIGTNTEIALQNAKSYPIISTSLITDEFQGTYNKRKFGFVYKPYVKNVLLISSTDCNANAMYFSESIDAKSFSLTSIPLTVNKYLVYNDLYACKTNHIEEIEKESKKLQKNGIADLAEHKINETVLINDSSTNPVAVFILETDNTDESTVGQAEELARKLNLPLLRI
ncbi:hypothetical protein BK120_22755 [Paenibacillus sp. FSL A5-0031]|uniref:hypothetical protein n=1 Tax=Paenibacillus sp. FSL A5-0031 TaxID=1920420 RepID=UPI00096D93A5|nr:hypothetical protein [Paenibacillus sp. FSL A5-0031]OME78564.1 hypothetical protein BK120_22755 [Paenibacillus sp. FSL A5-0031]